MRLKKIEIFGFKSFPEKTVLNFQPGITCIVGPNGCGKSNVVDAILWVMGEQSTKTLRGEKMEDVIFFGSESRRAIGMAEVTLTIGDMKGELPSQYAEYSEIEITRRLFRSGESEYLINNVPCRLRDIKDVLIDAGIGFKGHTVIEQGRVERILTSTPEDRRAIIEDTAGIMKYKFRKTEALRKLEATQHNLLRVRDIISEVKRQISSLDRQVRKAKEYQELSGRIKDHEVALTVAKYTAKDNELKELLQREEAIKEEEMQARSELLRSEAEEEGVRTAIIEDDRNLAGLRQSLNELDREISGGENKIILIENQAGHYRGEIERLVNEISRFKEDLTTLRVSLDSFNMERVIVEEFLAKGEEVILEEEKRYETANREFHNLQETLENVRILLFSTVAKITEAKNRETLIRSRISELSRIKERSLTERDEGFRAISDIEQQSASKEGVKNGVRNNLYEKQQLLASLSDKLTSLENAIGELTEGLNEKREMLHRGEARYHSLEEMEKNLIGYQEGVKSILLSKAKGDANLDGIYGIVADFLDVENNPPIPPFNKGGKNVEGLSPEKVIEAVLGERLQNIVVKDHEESKRAIEFLKSSNGGRSAFIPAEPRVRAEGHTLPDSTSGVIGQALSLIDCKDGYKALAESLLSDVIVVDNLDTALVLWKENNNGYTFVTLDGEIVEPDGRITGGISGGKSQGLIQKRRELRTLKADVARLHLEVSALEEEAGRMKREQDLVKSRTEEVHGHIRQEELSLLNVEKDLEALKDEERRRQLQVETISAEERGIDAEINALNLELNRHDSEIQALAAEQGAMERRIQELIETQKTGRERWEEAQKEITARKLEIATHKEKRESLSIRIREIEGRIEDAGRAIEEREGQLLKIHQKIDECSAEKSSIGLAIKELCQKKDALSKEIVERDGERLSREEGLKVLEGAIRENRKRIEDLKTGMNQLEVQKAETRLQTGHLRDFLYSTYQLALEEEINNPGHRELIERSNTEELSTAVAGLKERLNRMGPVNLASIEEYQGLNQRYEFLTSQESDLTQACETLHKTISKINKTTKEMFLITFNIINEKFQNLFHLFFQGGSARLVLTDENNVLESGIEIFAQPPGKRVNQLALLSGGEKALTAMALLFATFLARPTPFCVLDEIDAPLDEVNTDRFIRTLRNMTEFSQFIVITHNKCTMEAADTLYGVTMEEPGVSKLISVNLTRREQIEDQNKEMEEIALPAPA